VIRGISAPDLWARLLINRGELELELDEIPSARDSFSSASNLISDSSPRFFRTIITSGMGYCALRHGDLSGAKRWESLLPDLPQHWTFDPSVVALFKVALFRMRGDLQGASEFLGTIADGIENRFVTTWVKINIRRVKILRRISEEASRQIAARTLEKASALGLSARSVELQQLLDRWG